MTKKELKEAISKLCDIIDCSEINSAEYKKALKDIKELQKNLQKPL